MKNGASVFDFLTVYGQRAWNRNKNIWTLTKDTTYTSYHQPNIVTLLMLHHFPDVMLTSCFFSMLSYDVVLLLPCRYRD